MAATLYEPAFAVTAAWFIRHRARAVLVLTIAGGLSSTVFIPLTGVLVAYLTDRGYSLTQATAAAGAVGAFHVIGRLACTAPRPWLPVQRTLAGLSVTVFGGHRATLVGAAALTAIGAYALYRAHHAFTDEAAYASSSRRM